ncbi:MAG TPA: adenosylmethionine decarboxylase [Candidatus Brocadiales bacterium]|nr:adenosylmethionine decarboxylase [Candidatus Brocadiales bacterium]
METFGRHLIVEMWDCDREILNNAKRLREILRRAAEEARATVIRVFCHEFNPKGITGVALLAESHLAIHTWPEEGYAAADIFTCGQYTDPQLAAQYLISSLKAKDSTTLELKRGSMQTREVAQQSA